MQGQRSYSLKKYQQHREDREGENWKKKTQNPLRENTDLNFMKRSAYASGENWPCKTQIAASQLAQFLPPFTSTSFFSIETWQSGNSKSSMRLRWTTLDFMKAHLQINKFSNFLIFSFQNTSERNTDNRSTHPCQIHSKFCILWACEVTKVLQVFKIPRGQFLNLYNRPQYQKIMFIFLSCIYLLSSFKSNFKVNH